MPKTARLKITWFTIVWCTFTEGCENTRCLVLNAIVHVSVISFFTRQNHGKSVSRPSLTEKYNKV